MNKLKLKEATPQPVMDFRVISEVDPCSLPVIYEPQHNPLSILEHYGYKPKVFCSAGVGSYASGFEVKSKKWNWIVTRVDEKNISQIPHEFLRGLGVLLKNNIRIDSVAIAKPKPIEDRSEVIKQELCREVRAVSRIGRSLFLLIAARVRSAVDTISTTSQSFMSAALVEMRDPVLLVRIQDKWIEIGRWM